MRKSLYLICTLTLIAGCKSSPSGEDGGQSAQPVSDSPTINTDRTQLLFGGDYGQAVLLGAKPPATLQIFDQGRQDLQISSVDVVSGTGPDGGALSDTAAFSVSGPDKTDVAFGDSAVVQVVFDSTVVGTGWHGAVLEIKSNAQNSPTLDIPMIVDVVSPEVSVVGGSTDITVPDVTLHPLTTRDGGPDTFPDGGTIWQQSSGTATAYFENTGTAQLQFTSAALASDAGAAPFLLCSNAVYAQDPTKCQAGPVPNTLARIYPDGGLSGAGLPDGGFLPDRAQLQVVFQPSAPGSFEQHVVIESNATNVDGGEIVLTVHATAAGGP